MTTDTIVQLPLDQLVESPFNPRKVFNEEALRELAVTIEVEGRVLQPILVRPRPRLPGSGFEIVFGHRRYRAAILAGLTDIPAMVRAMTDDEARRAQIAENLQRADVHPIEEAEGFQALIDLDQQTADDVAAQVGKSRSYVYGRLKLLAAVPEIRKACLAGEIGSEVALLIARLRTDKLQAKALGYIRAAYLDLDDGGAKSYRRIRDMLNEKFTLKLSEAMFDVDDEMLLPEAGYCGRCPKRAGNAPEFEDIIGQDESRHGYLKHTGADICTDPDCFDAKKKAHLAREAAKIAATGKVMVTGNAARAAVSAQGEIKGAYIELAEVKKLLKAGGHSQAAFQDHVVTIQDPRTGKLKQAVKREHVTGGGIKLAEPKATQRPSYEEDRKKREAAEQIRDQAAKVETSINLILLDKVRAAAVQQPRGAFDTQLIAQLAWAGVEYRNRQSLAKLYDKPNGEALGKYIGQMPGEQLGFFMLDCALIDNVYLDGWSAQRGDKPDALLAAAKHYGIDAAVVRAEATGEASKPAPKKKAKAAQAAEVEPA